MALLSAAILRGGAPSGRIVGRGTFDAYAAYRPGDVVVSDGVAYVNIAAVGGSPSLVDTFGRPDATGWGTSDSGHAWQTSADWAGSGPALIRGGRALLWRDADDEADGQLLGPSAALGDAELLVGFTPLAPADGGTTGLLAYLQATEDAVQGTGARVGFDADGTNHVWVANFNGTTGDATDEFTPVAPVAVGVPLWLRFRRHGTAHSVSLWEAGSPEPAAFLHTLTNAQTVANGHPVLAPNTLDIGATVEIAHISVRPITAATAPADDTDHWQPVAAAFDLPTPV